MNSLHCWVICTFSAGNTVEHPAGRLQLAKQLQAETASYRVSELFGTDFKYNMFDGESTPVVSSPATSIRRLLGVDDDFHMGLTSFQAGTVIMTWCDKTAHKAGCKTIL